MREEVKELGRSKWSNDLDEDDTERTDGLNGHANALSGLIQAYAKEGKSVRWMDQVCVLSHLIHFISGCSCSKKYTNFAIFAYCES